ncbi:transglutaminase family protein [Aquisphaera insulae]|uniref:transglutaminase family protein n=1 Tax=Aquisphaera insulae TaxID=2712864 RepID=UPI0013ED79C5|nr:transglutaminase family protein [Aquisphaera insulae]
MKRIRIIHDTAYHYKVPVTFGPHRALLRPREGHDLHIDCSTLLVEPEASVRWYRDIYGNSIAIITFLEPGPKLHVHSEIDVDLYEDVPIDCTIDPMAQEYPFQYDATDQVEIMPYRLPSYPHDGPAVQRWLRDLYQPGQKADTAELLDRLNTRIFESFRYAERHEMGVQIPCRTLELGSGSCRDFAVFMMEAARHWGLAARFVTGYIQMAEGQHGSTHAWTEIYLPGAGWRGFDPTNNKPAGTEHISVAVARAHEKASPLSGYWDGPGDAFERMEVSVQVVAQ